MRAEGPAWAPPDCSDAAWRQGTTVALRAAGLARELRLLRPKVSTLECIACHRPIEPGEPMVVVITALPSRLSRVPLLRHVDAAPGRWHWRCAPRSVRRYAPPITLFDPPGSVD